MMMGGTTRRHSDDKPNDNSVTKKNTADQITLKKQVFQSFFIRSTKTARIDVGHVKRGAQPGACVQNTVCNLPIQIITSRSNGQRWS